LAFFALVLPACREKKEVKREIPPAPVVTATAQARDLPRYLLAVGNVRSMETASIRSKVPGYLQKVEFRDGAYVKRGQPLFTIDPASYEAAVRQLEAQLATARTRYAQAERDFKRWQDLVASGSVSHEEYEQKRLERDTAADTIASTEANLASARNALTYCFITSPIEGLAGYTTFSTGDFIRDKDDILVTVNQMAPIAVDFYLPQEELAPVRRAQAEGPLEVMAIIPGDDTPALGRLTFIDNAVDLATGTIWMQGTFDNPDMRLWPGHYVKVRLRLAVDRGAVVIPFEATCQGPEGAYVWVLDAEKKAAMRPVAIARRSGKLDVVAKGLAPGETVVVDGQVRLFPGATAAVRGTAEPEAAADGGDADGGAPAPAAPGAPGSPGAS
jgi:multidrug efflux system membrane fusion protein